MSLLLASFSLCDHSISVLKSGPSIPNNQILSRAVLFSSQEGASKEGVDDSTLFNQLNDLNIDDVEKPELKEALKSAVIATMELGLGILEMEQTPEKLSLYRRC